VLLSRKEKLMKTTPDDDLDDARKPG